MSHSPPDLPPHQEEVNPPRHDAVDQLIELLTDRLLARAPQAPVQAPEPPGAQPRARVKTRNPEPYDGSDPEKLRAFISQCRLAFRSRPNDFANDQIKITYAVSWLKGTALRWYEPTLDLPDDDLPDYATHWPAFVEALKATFGEPDPASAATTKLDNLTMKDHHHIGRYNVDFNEYAAKSGYNDHALYTRYYKGLPTRLKDNLALSTKPTTLAGLRHRAQVLDLRHWERQDEDRPKGVTTKSTSSASSSSYSSKSPSSSSKTYSKPKTSTPVASSSKAKKPDLSDVLGPDGRLLPEEKERRKKNNLCLICASKDHFSDKCPSRKTPAKARAADLEPLVEDDEQDFPSSSEDESSELPN